MKIERSRTSDFLEIARLDREAWAQNRNSEYIPDGEHAWRLWTEHALVYCAWDGDMLVGAVLAFPTTTEGLYCLHKVFVDLAYRGKGLGSELFDAVLKACDERGLACFLTVDPVNESAVRLYEKWGFTDRQFVKGYYRPEEDRLVLTRQSRREIKE
jgi:phosphinothricin acetyltransferase